MSPPSDALHTNGSAAVGWNGPAGPSDSAAPMHMRPGATLGPGKYMRERAAGRAGEVHEVPAGGAAGHVRPPDPAVACPRRLLRQRVAANCPRARRVGG